MSEIEEILDPEEDRLLLLLGNEAVARGVLEAGVAAASTYPGTPSSEVGDVLYRISGAAGIRFEFSVNEKVAVEVAFAASTLGLRSFVFMKHVGLNVASDAVMSIAYTGIDGGMVIMTADDPSMHSSQNEQDNRHYGELAHIPVIEPSTPQEAKDFLVYAFDLSERLHIPVLFRTTTRVSHERSVVKTGPVREIRKNISFTEEKDRYNSLPSFARSHKLKLEEKLRRISEETGSDLMVESDGNGEWGVITSGVAYNYISDVVRKNDMPVSILKLGITNPLQTGRILEFMRAHRNIIVVEELDPVLESRIRILAQMNVPGLRVYGKLDGHFPMNFEYNSGVVTKAVAGIMGLDITAPEEKVPDTTLPLRPPVLCPGCPHRASFYIVKRAMKMMKMEDAIISSDIGCYSLGSYQPFEMGDIILSMGSSVGYSSGMVPEFGKRSISFIGDSTFFHGGIPAIINAVRNGSQTTIIILDNRTTAMTGQQPNPGANDPNLAGAKDEVSIESILKGIGVKEIRVTDPYDLKDMLRAVTDSLRIEGVSVVIARRECAILRDKRLRREGTMIPYRVNLDVCTGCMRCVTDFACPAISVKGEKVAIDPALCDGCGVCAQRYVCPYGAMEVDQNGN